MSPCKDPDEFLKTFGAQEYKQRITRSATKIDFQLQYLAAQYDLSVPEQKKEFLKKTVETMMAAQTQKILSQTSENARSMTRT